MLRCYLIALCAGSALDRVSNNFTLFNVFETLRLPPAMLGQALPFEAHFYWLIDDAARNRDFELRLVRVAADGSEDPGGAIPFSPGDRVRYRVRTQAIRAPHAFGNYTLRVQWRLAGEETWTTDPVIWPLEFLEWKEEMAHSEPRESHTSDGE